jgi:hypothetical protein
MGDLAVVASEMFGNFAFEWRIVVCTYMIMIIDKVTPGELHNYKHVVIEEIFGLCCWHVEDIQKSKWHANTTFSSFFIIFTAHDEIIPFNFRH